MGKTLVQNEFYPATKPLLRLPAKQKNLNHEQYYKHPIKFQANLMCYHLKTNFGGTEAVIDDNCGVSKFYSIADILTDGLKVKFINQVDDADTLDWDFRYKKHYLTLHYNIFNGVSILPHATKGIASESKAVIEVAKFLEKNAY